MPLTRGCYSLLLFYSLGLKVYKDLPSKIFPDLVLEYVDIFLILQHPQHITALGERRLNPFLESSRKAGKNQSVFRCHIGKPIG